MGGKVSCTPYVNSLAVFFNPGHTTASNHKYKQGIHSILALAVLTLWLQFNNDRRNYSCHAALQHLTHRPQVGMAAFSVSV